MGETRMARTRARVTRYLHKRGEESGRDDHTQTNIPTYALERWVHYLHSSLHYSLPFRALHAIEHTWPATHRSGRFIAFIFAPLTSVALYPRARTRVFVTKDKTTQHTAVQTAHKHKHFCPLPPPSFSPFSSPTYWKNGSRTPSFSGTKVL